MAGSINQLGQYTNSPGNSLLLCKLTISSLMVAITIARIHFAYPQRDDQSWVGLGDLVKYQDGTPKNRHISQ